MLCRALRRIVHEEAAKAQAAQAEGDLDEGG
jgi:hypothetical protein